jgi:hypothetical protein
MTQTLPLAHVSSIVLLKFMHSSNPLTVSCLLDSGSPQNNYVSKRLATWCRDQFQRKRRQAEGGSVCSPIAKDYVASTLTLHTLNVEFFDSVKSKQAVLTFDTLPFTNTSYDVESDAEVLCMKVTPNYQHQTSARSANIT